MELSFERADGVVYCDVDGRVDNDTADFRDGVWERVGENDRMLWTCRKSLRWSLATAAPRYETICR